MADNSELDPTDVQPEDQGQNVDLNFKTTLGSQDPNDIKLNFSFDVPVEDITGRIKAIFPGIQGSFSVERPPARAFSGQIQAPTLPRVQQKVITYDNRVYRPIGPLSRDPWEQAVKLKKETEQVHETTVPQQAPKQEPWEETVGMGTATTAPHALLVPQPEFTVLPWEVTDKLTTFGGFSIHSLDPRKYIIDALWEEAVGLGDYATSFFQIGVKINRERGLPWQVAQAIGFRSAMSSQVGVPLGRGLKLPWEEGRRPPPGMEYIPPIEPPHPPFEGDTDLNFVCKLLAYNGLNVPLNFGSLYCPVLPGHPGFIIPTRRVYFVLNNIVCTRVDDGTPIELMTSDISIDRQSWCWGFSGTIAAKDFDKVEPGSDGPVAIQIVINGFTFRFLVEDYGDKQTFGTRDISISGRSLTAYLDSPYAPTRSLVQVNAITSRQMAEEELIRAGLITGYSLDWTLIDALGWQLPDNTWQYQDQTPIQVIKSIANGVGGYVNSHPWDKIIQVRSAYPATPWEWDTTDSDIILPRDIIVSQSLTWGEKPDYNGVYVSGDKTGVTAFGKRDGTAGDLQMPMVVDAMISDVAAARERVRSELSTAGKQATVSIELPLADYTGLFLPGQLVTVDETTSSTPNWKGLVRGVSIGSRWSDTLEVTQTIELERHY